MKQLLVVFGLVVFAASGCVDSNELNDTTSQRIGAAHDISKTFPADMDVVVVDMTRDSISTIAQALRLRGSLGFDGLGIGPGTPDVGPCNCDGPICVESWVEDNLGCNVCAVFLCDGAPTVHACHVCP